MGLNRYKISSLISAVDERNTEDIREFYGVNINKEFMPTVANTNGLNGKKYKVIRKGRFVFSGMQTGRDECIRISMYMDENPIIVSPAYTTFEVTAEDKVTPLYFFMVFLSKEKDRLGWFYSDGSIRANLDWDRFCDIELDLPPLAVQHKYVNIYKAMVANQQSYEHGLDDLKQALYGLFDKIKYSCKKLPMSELVSEIDERNESGNCCDVQGINITKQFMTTAADTNGIDLTKYKVVRKGQLAFSGMQTGRDKCIRIAMHTKEEPIIVSPAYTVFEVNRNIVLSEYVMCWFSRPESDRLGWFMSDSSIRSNLDLDRLYETAIPIPALNSQRAIADIYKVYTERRRINEQLKDQIKNICPILIRGSLLEGGR